MRKISKLLSVLVLAAMILAACGGEETNTSIPTENVPPTTVEATATSAVSSETATEAPTEATTTSTPGTSGIPVTGHGNSDRLSNELKFTVWDQSGKQVGKVDDMVLDLSKAKVLYVIVSAEKKIAVPWAFLKVGTASTNANANGQQNAFILQTDTDTFKNAPEFDVKNMPQLGEAPDSWDIRFRNYWKGGGAASGNNTPSPAGTAITDMTATATSTSNTGTGNATSTPSSAGTGVGTGAGQGATSIQGVQLASKVLNAKLTVAVQGLGLATSIPGAGAGATGLATSTPSTGNSTGLATSTPSTSGGAGLASSTPSTSGGSGLATSTPVTSVATGSATSTPSTVTSKEVLTATIDDMIVNTDLGDITYIVVKTSFADGEHLIPVPLGLLKFDSENQAFGLDFGAAMLQNAPSFQSDQFPDLTMPDWNSEFDSFWQNNGSGGAGAASQATPTP